MVYEHVFIKGSLKDIADKRYKEGWRLAYYDKETNISLWDKEIKKKYNTKKESFKEFDEFIGFYKKNFKTNGLNDPKLISKYKEILNEGVKHSDILQNLKQYKEYLDIKKYLSPVMPGTYLNGKRYKDKYDLGAVYYAHKWRKDMLEDQKVPKNCLSAIELEAKAWEKNHPGEDLTTNQFQMMIDKYFIPKNEK